ncbi:MAG: cytochrome b N-terminal domain-containing protein [Pseudomonadota bacterium]
MEKRYSLSFSLPRLGLASLILCLISGLVLIFQYQPIGDVFQNVEEITTVIPYGGFFRQLHHGSGQIFVIMMLFHTLDHLLKRRYERYPFKEWALLIIPLFLCLFTLFTGFILKGDKEGSFAGFIFLSLLLEVPLVGHLLSGLFIIPGKTFFLLPYLHHCFLLPILIIFFIRDHIREWFPDYRFIFITTFGLFLYALFVAPNMAIPPEAEVPHIKGPWFFLGIQTLLRMMPPLWAGLILPGLVVGSLLILPLLKGAWAKIIHFLIMISFLFYTLLSFREYFH